MTTNEAVVAAFYRALAERDLEAFAATLDEDIVLNVHGSTPVSGRYEGRRTMLEDVVPQVFDRLDADRFRFAVRWKIMCADADRVTAFMEAEGLARGGERYDQRYCQVFELRGGRIVELWEFFDSCLAQRALFGNPLQRAESPPASPFRF